LLYDKIFKRISKTIEDDKVKSVLVPFLRKVTNVTNLLGIKELKKLAFKTLHEKFGGNIRMFIAGGAAVDPLVAKGLREFGFVFLQGYGLTETSPILALNRLDQFKDNAAGLLLPSVELKINNQDEFGVGEIFVKAPNVMIGYYKNDLATSEAFEDGWFKTGDLAKIDEEGFVYISGRAKNVIISNSGKNVYPEELEDLLNRSEYILESVVYGEEDDKHDEVISAKIVVDAESIIVYSEKNNIKITNELLNEIISKEIQIINKQLASFKHIKRFYIQEHEFEKTTTQKIKRYLVKK
jgi:long-chain acyl-CoA synthetase